MYFKLNNDTTNSIFSSENIRRMSIRAENNEIIILYKDGYEYFIPYTSWYCLVDDYIRIAKCLGIKEVKIIDPSRKRSKL